jgi:hypothetical protein
MRAAHALQRDHALSLRLQTAYHAAIWLPQRFRRRRRRLICPSAAVISLSPMQSAGDAKECIMASNVSRFDESWEIPGASVEEVYNVLAHGELLPLWWKGVYLEAEKLTPNDEPRVGDRIRARARGFLPYELNFIVEAAELEPSKRVVVKTIGDFDGRWSAALTPREGGVHVDLVWEVSVLRPILRLFAPLLRPAFAWNHRWTTPRGEKGLREYLAEKRR